jgi:hypothetical protein
MRFELLPPTQAGPVTVGMILKEAQETLRQLPGYVHPDPLRPPQRTYANYDNGLSIGVDLRDGLVIAVELYRPDDQVAVVYDEIAVFQQTADQVITLVGDRTRLDIVEDGRTAVAPRYCCPSGAPPFSRQDPQIRGLLRLRPGRRPQATTPRAADRATWTDLEPPASDCHDVTGTTSE